MNYKIIYEKIISNAKSRTTLLGYYEKHHILPKSLGGSNNDDNLVKLSAREHFICHWLLVKMYNKGSFERNKMLYAFWRMRSSPDNNGKRYTNSRAYEKLRIEYSNMVSTEINQKGENNSQYGKHWYTNYETGESKSFLSKPNEKWIEGRNLFHNEYSKLTLKKLIIKNSKSKTQLETELLWNKYHSGNYGKLEDFANELKISKVALHNRFTKYIPIYTKHKQLKRKHFISDKNLINVYS